MRRRNNQAQKHNPDESFAGRGSETFTLNYFEITVFVKQNPPGQKSATTGRAGGL
jgi:hypothetical protein